MKKTFAAMTLAVTAIVTLSACGDSDNSRKETLAALADQTIIPSYRQFADDASKQGQAVDELCLDPTNEKSTLALNAINTTRTSWKKSEAVWVGPVMTSRSWALIDYPISEGDINAVITNTSLSKLDYDTISKRVGADERGIQALEFLIKGGNLKEARRCDYIKAIAETISKEANKIVTQWTQVDGDQPSYRDELVKDPSMSLDAVVNDQINVLNKLTGTEFGWPGNAARLEGVEAVLVGSGSTKGLSPLLGNDLTERIKTAISEAKDAPADQQKDKLEALKKIVGTEVVSRLGVAVGFSDTDGDSAK